VLGNNLHHLPEEWFLRPRNTQPSIPTLTRSKTKTKTSPNGMPSTTSFLNTRKFIILAISLIPSFAPAATCLPTTTSPALLQPPLLVKMGIVPPNIHSQLAKNPSLSDEQRQTAQKNADHSQEISLRKYEDRMPHSVPRQVLQRLADDKALASGCTDDVKQEVGMFLHNAEVLPDRPEFKVSDGLKAVLDANPGLWEEAASQDAGGSGEEKK
jgi:hypothetical protein